MSNLDVPASPPDSPTASALSNLATFATLTNAALFAPLAVCAFLVAIARYEPILPNMLEVVALGSAAASLLTSLIAGSVRISGRTGWVGPLVFLSSVAGVAAAGLAILFFVLFEVRPNLIVAFVAVLWPMATGLLRKRVFDRPFSYSANASLALTVGAVCLLMFSLASCCSGIVFSNFMGWTTFPEANETTEATTRDANEGSPSTEPTGELAMASAFAQGWKRIDSPRGLSVEAPSHWEETENAAYGVAASFGDGRAFRLDAYCDPRPDGLSTSEHADLAEGLLPQGVRIETIEDRSWLAPEGEKTQRLLRFPDEAFYLVTVRDAGALRYASVFTASRTATEADIEAVRRIEASLRYIGDEFVPDTTD